METVIKAESIFIQTEFPESAEKLLRRSFNLQEKRCAANEFTESIISMISALRIELN